MTYWATIIPSRGTRDSHGIFQDFEVAVEADTVVGAISAAERIDGVAMVTNIREWRKGYSRWPDEMRP